MFKVTVAKKEWHPEYGIDYSMGHEPDVPGGIFQNKSNKPIVRNVLPNFGSLSNHQVGCERLIDTNINDYVNTSCFSNNYAINSSIDLFQGFKKINSIEMSRLLYHSSLEETSKQKYLLTFNVVSAYYDVMFYLRLTDMLRHQKEVSEYSLEIIKNQINLGLKPGSDMHQIQIAMKSSTLVLTRALSELERARLRLIWLISIQDGESISIDTSIVDMTNL